MGNQMTGKWSNPDRLYCFAGLFESKRDRLAWSSAP